MEEEERVEEEELSLAELLESDPGEVWSRFMPFTMKECKRQAIINAVVERLLMQWTSEAHDKEEAKNE